MLKKVLIISASPRRHGNSDTLCDEFAKGAEEAGNTVEKVFLRDKKIAYCTGCCYCAQTDYNGCSQHDDMDELLDKMINADVIVFSSPVYFYSINAQMKTFIDRCCAKHAKMINKDFYLIVTATDDNPAMLEPAFDTFRGFLDCLENPVEKGDIYAAGLWHKGEVHNTSYKQEAYNMGKSV